MFVKKGQITAFKFELINTCFKDLKNNLADASSIYLRKIFSSILVKVSFSLHSWVVNYKK